MDYTKETPPPPSPLKSQKIVETPRQLAVEQCQVNGNRVGRP